MSSSSAAVQGRSVVNPGEHPVEWSGELSAADWILDRVQGVDHDLAGTVASLVPEGFAAYARVLHPASRSAGSSRIGVRWAELAQPRGVKVHATTQFEDLVAGAPVMSDIDAPRVGSLERDELDALIELLANDTSSPDSCWFGIWDGYGWMRGFPAYDELHPVAEVGGRRPEPITSEIAPPAPTTPRLMINGRALVLYRGSIDQARAFCKAPAEQSPNLWWPNDRAWCVATEIDFSSTYVAGSDALVEQLRHDRRLEAIRVDPTNRVTD